MLESNGSARSVRLIEPIQGFALVNRFCRNKGRSERGNTFPGVSSAPADVVRTGETIGKFNRVKANSKTIARRSERFLRMFKRTLCNINLLVWG